MPYKYIGRTVDFKGKTLWEILGNLKNFGVGRIVSRNRFQRYEEPVYMKIMKVEALSVPKNPSYDNVRKVIALVEKTFRGVKQQNLVQLESSTYKADHFLIPKHKENEFCQPVTLLPTRILPREMEFPPLLKEIIIRQMKASGQPITKPPKMRIHYNRSGMKIKTYRVAKEGEEPTEPEPSTGLGKPISPRLYEKVEGL